MNNYLVNVLVTGGNGQLAQALRHHQDAKRYALHFLSHAELDITSLPSVVNAIKLISPDIIINTAAYTAVDKAEAEYAIADQVNHLGAQYLAMVCQKQHIPLIHLSTDYVFDGHQTTPYKEDAKPHPINHYGKTKYLGEEAVREHCEQHIILRVSGVFSTYGNNFYKTMLRLAQERDEIRVVNDQITCPTNAHHIASALFTLISVKNHWGTYHYCDQPAISWYEFANTIINAARTKQQLRVKTITPITTADYPTAAKRPLYSVLDCHKIEKTFGIKQSNWLQAIIQREET